MPEDLMRYDLLAQDALRGVVRTALARAAGAGLPGEHHFFVAFDTRHPGVEISDRLRQMYPEEITIVLQHQFWNLEVDEHAFAVGLSFDNVPEKLVVPFEAVKGFFDPAVQFGLQFETRQAPAAEPGEEMGPAAAQRDGTPEAAPSLIGGDADAPGAGGDSDEAGQGPKVVTLDSFRKK